MRRRRRAVQQRLPNSDEGEGDVFATLAGDELADFHRDDISRDIREMGLAASSRVYSDRRRAF